MMNFLFTLTVGTALICYGHSLPLLGSLTSAVSSVVPQAATGAKTAQNLIAAPVAGVANAGDTIPADANTVMAAPAARVAKATTDTESEMAKAASGQPAIPLITEAGKATAAQADNSEDKKGAGAANVLEGLVQGITGILPLSQLTQAQADSGSTKGKQDVGLGALDGLPI